jgi:EAL domain-containing protein (putative c-di-GMP-specific phosphodiesterase class I)
MYEVLLRLRSDTGELISPSAFLSVAERVDLIQEIDRLVIEQTLAALAGARFPVTLSVNVSGKSIAEPELLATIARQLTETGVDPGSLVIEVTETAAISHIESARAFAAQLQRLGCRLAIDDFGAGFGSFTYLKHFPFDFLKIDGEFVAGAMHSRADAVIVEAVRHMAHGLDRAVIAEHCSSAALVEFLRREGIDFRPGLPPRSPRAAGCGAAARPARELTEPVRRKSIEVKDLGQRLHRRVRSSTSQLEERRHLRLPPGVDVGPLHRLE